MDNFESMTFESNNNFKIVEIDSHGEEGRIDYSLEVDDKTALSSILLEGEFSDIKITFNDAPLQENKETTFTTSSESAFLYTNINPAPRHGKSNVRITGRFKKGKRSKISILNIFNRTGKFWGPISCTACKRLIRFLVSAMITPVGFTDLSLNDMLPEQFWDWIKEAKFPSAITKIFEYIPADFANKFLEALRWLAGFLNEALTPLDNILTKICLRLGMCKNAT